MTTVSSAGRVVRLVMDSKTQKLMSQHMTVTYLPNGYQVFRPGFGPPKRFLPQCVIAHNGVPIRRNFTYFGALRFVEEAIKESDRHFRAFQRRRFESGGKRRPRSKRKGRKK